MRALLDVLRERVDDDVIAATDARFLRAAQSVLQLWRQWWGPDKPVSVPTEVELKFRMIYPLALHALNNVAVAADLVDRLPWVATGLARIAFEHALTAQWVLLTYDGEQQVLLELQEQAHKRAAEFHKGLGSPEEYAAMVGQKPPASTWSVWSACSRFTDSPQLFYDVYRNLSGATHPSYGTVLAYLDVDSEGKLTDLNPIGAAKPSDETPRALGVAALWALDAVEELRDGRPHIAELTAVGDAAELPTCLRDSDQHPERQHAPG